MKRLLCAALVLAAISSKGAALNLTQSVDLAVKQNPTVAASQKRASAAQARLNQALSAFFPKVNLSGSLDKAHSTPQTVQISSGGTTQVVTFGINENATISGLKADLSQPVFVSALFPEYGIAKKSADSAGEALQQQIIDVSFDATRAYFQVLRAIKMEKLIGDSLEMATAHRQQVQSMLNAGLAKKADLLRSKVREANYNVDLIKAKYGIALSNDAFNNVLGNPMGQAVNLKDEGFTGTVKNIPDYAALITAAYENRPDWRAFLLKVGIKEDQVRLSQSEYLPNIKLSADTGSQLTRYPSFQSDVNSWKVAGIGSWQLFDSFGRENRIREASEALEAQRSDAQQLKNNIALEVHSAYLNLKSAIDTVVAAQQAVDSAQESYKVASSLYRSGLGTNVDVLDAQVDLTGAWTDQLDALFEVEVAKAQINKAVGKKVI